MVTVKLIAYKIRSLDMTNTMESSGPRVLTSELRKSKTNLIDDGRMAISLVMQHLFCEANPEEFEIWVELEGIFAVQGADGSAESKRELRRQCLDVLYPHTDQVVMFLMKHSSMPSISKIKEMDGKDIGPNAEKEGGEGEIIELPEDTDK